jgi:DNA-binding response OmpR family regulator
MKIMPPPAVQHPTSRVIIVEDDLEYAKALKLRLERKCGCNVTKMYAHGISFLNDLEEIDADYVIIDHNLPQKNGSEMVQAIHAAQLTLLNSPSR